MDTKTECDHRSNTSRLTDSILAFLMLFVLHPLSLAAWPITLVRGANGLLVDTYGSELVSVYRFECGVNLQLQ